MPIVTFEKKKPLNSSPEDFIFTTVNFDENSKKLVSFSVLQVYFAGENSYEIIRFDTAHDFCHVHRFYKQLDHEGEKLTDKEISSSTFEGCRADIKTNWKKYKRLYVDKWLR